MGVTVPIEMGRLVNGVPVSIDLMKASHLAIQGQTRSGKSVLAYNLLGSLVGRDDVRVIGCDPSGILLAPFAEAGEALVSLGQDDVTRHLEVLSWAKRAADERIRSMPAARVDSIKQISRETPLIVVVCEEYPALLEAAEDEDAAEGRRASDRLEPKIRRLVRQLAAQSAKAAVRLVLLAQRAEASILGGATRSNFGTRITLRADNGDSVRMLHPNASDELISQVEAFAPGVGIIEAPSLPRTIFRGHFVDYETFVNRVVRTRRAVEAERPNDAREGEASVTLPLLV